MTMKPTHRELRKQWRTHLKLKQKPEHDIRVGFAANITIDPIEAFLGANLLNDGFSNPDIALGNYDQIIQTCLNLDTHFGALDAIVIVFRIEDLVSDLSVDFVRQSVDLLFSAFEQLRQSFGGTIILVAPPRPRSVASDLGVFSRPNSLDDIWCSTLLRISQLSRDVSNLYVVDTEAIISALGEGEALDYRNDLMYRQPYREPLFAAISEKISRILRLKKAEAKKCLVLDCDNTLWGGVVGEDGVDGIHLSDDMPGRAYVEFQKQILELRKSGIFIALSSKNNPEAVWEVFDGNNAMVLKKEDVASARINWRPKSESLKEIASELNIGLDSLVFMDDSSFECEEVRAHAPQVATIQIPEDPAEIPVVMTQVARMFDRLDITSDDRKRVDMIRSEGERRNLRQKMTEDDFLATLGLEVFLYEPAEMDRVRVTQLVNKTNQFNVTTQRYSLEEIEEKIADESVDLFCATVRDKFGDYGLVGLAIIETRENIAVFDSLLMSCRVLGRGIETSIVEHSKKLAAERGLSEIMGIYKPTSKNQMVADLFSRHGFLQSGEANEEGETVWTASTSPKPVPIYLEQHNSRPTGGK